MIFRKKKKEQPDPNPNSKDLDSPILSFTDHPADTWTLRDAVTGVQIFGGIGSGKSSGSGKTIALSLLEAGYGGLVLTAKPDETESWLRYAQRLGISDRFVVFGDRFKVGAHKKNYPAITTGHFTFNPLAYENERPQAEGGGQTKNIVNLFTSIIRMGNRISGSGGGGSKDPFWDLALDRCMTAAIDLLKLAKKSGIEGFDFSIANISRLIREATREPKHENDLTYTLKCLADAQYYIDEKSKVQDSLTEEQKWDFEREQRAFENANNYFEVDFRSLSDQLRASISEMFYAFASPFMTGLLADYFSGETSPEVRPEETFNGKVIILDFSVKEYLQAGITAQAIYKNLWQQAVERRKVDDHTIPVFLWMDEAQYFLNEQDMMFQTTARSSRCCTVLLTQNINNYYAVMGGNRPKERVDSLMGNLVTKIFHNNTDATTNEWAAKVISRTVQSRVGVSINQTQTTSLSQTIQYQVQPHEFTMLQRGGGADGVVEAYITGRTWSTGENFLKVEFAQDIEQNSGLWQHPPSKQDPQHNQPLHLENLEKMEEDSTPS